MKRTMLVAAILLATTIVGGAPAQATSTGPAAAPRPVPVAVAEPKTDLTLSYMAEVGFAAAVVLTCSPPGGGHPQPQKACKTLKSVDGDPGKLKPAAGLCTMEFAPITATVSGTWKGTPIHWESTFGNQCAMTRATGALFTF